MRLPDQRLLRGNPQSSLRPIADFQLVLPLAWAKIPVAPQDSDWPDRRLEPPDPGIPLDRDHYKASIARTQRPNLTVVEQHVSDIDLPVGPAVRERERVCRSSGGRFSRRETVSDTVIYTVFSPGSTDALQLTFSADALDLADKMAEDADVAVATLDILLGESDAAT